MGYLVLNLNEFINHGLKILTFKMDKEGRFYLTVQMSVVPYSEKAADILTMSMRTVMNSKGIAKSNSLTQVEGEDESSDEEVQGESLMNTYKHFH